MSAPNQSMGPTSVNGQKVGDGGYGPNYYSLTFEVKFKHDHDTVYFAHCYPFTYTDLNEFVKRVCTF